MLKDRDITYDIMKGIGILLVLVGHIPPSLIVYRFIYTFHMPMFFLLAGFFIKDTVVDDGKRELKKNIKRLLLPVLVTMLLAVCFSPLQYLLDKDWNKAISNLIAILWGGGDVLKTKFGPSGVGPMWFLLALFWAKEIMCVILTVWCRLIKWHDEIILTTCILLSICATIAHRYLPPMPMSFIQGISAMQFVGIGWFVKRHRPKLWIILLCVLIWPFAYFKGGIEMCSCSYSCYPIDVLGACGAVAVIHFFCKKIIKYHTRFNLCNVLIIRALLWGGQNSLAILCMHTLIDRKSYIVKAIKGVFGFRLSGFPNSLLHFSIIIGCVIFISYIPTLSKIYGTKRMVINKSV